MTELRKRNWDSVFFGFEVGSLFINKKMPADVLTDLLNKAKEKFRLLYIISNTKNNVLPGNFEKHKTYIDERIIFAKEVNSRQHNRDDQITEYAGTTDLAVLYDLAFESGKYSRFKMDKHFGEESFNRLYRLMIDNALTKAYADKVFIKNSHKIEGFVTVKQKEAYMDIGLIGVDPDFQGRGVGSLLMNRVEDYTFEKGINKIEVLTQQQNTIARRFYEKQGFHEARKEYIFHLWF